MGYVVQQEAGNSSFSVLFLSTVTMLLSGLSRCQFPGSCIKAGLSETSGKALEFIYAWLEIYGQLSFVALCGRCLSSTIDAIWGGPWHQYIQANFQPVPWTDMCPDFPTGVVTLLLGILTSLGLETNRQFRHGYHIASIAIVCLLTLLLFMPRHEQDTSFNALDLNLLEASAICCLPMSGALALTSPNEARPKLSQTDKRPQILGFTVLTQFLSLGLTTLVYTMCSTTKPLAWSIPIKNLNTSPIMHLLLSLLCLLALSLAIVDVFSQTWPLVRNLAVEGFIWPVFHKENPVTQTPVKCIAFVTLASTCLSVIVPTKTLLCGTLLPLLVGNIFTTVYIIRRSYSPFALILQEKSHDITLANTSSYQRMDPRPLPDEPDVDQIVLEYLGLSKPGNPNQKPFKAALVRRLIAVLLISQVALALMIRCITLQPHFFGFAAGSLALVWVACVGWLHYQPRVRQRENLQFQVSFPPFLTAIASLLNCLLLAHLSLSTWVAMITWTTIGVLLYVGYGKTHNRPKARMTNPQPVLQLGTWSHPATVRHIHIQPSSPTENPVIGDCNGIGLGTANETMVVSGTTWAEQPVYGGFRMWQVLFLAGGVLLVLVILLCCCVRIRIPRTKQEIEADFRRKQLAKRFREELKRIRNSEMDIMDLRNALDRVRMDFKSDSESFNHSDTTPRNGLSDTLKSGPSSSSNVEAQQWLELTLSNLKNSQKCQSPV